MEKTARSFIAWLETHPVTAIMTAVVLICIVGRVL